MLKGQLIGTYGLSACRNHWDTTPAAPQVYEPAGLELAWLVGHVMFLDKTEPEREVPVIDCFVALGTIAVGERELTARIERGPPRPRNSHQMWEAPRRSADRRA